MATKKAQPKVIAVPPAAPWTVKPFTDNFAFLSETRMLTGHALCNEILEWDLATGLVVKIRRKGRKVRESVSALATSPDRRRFLSACGDDVLREWSADGDAPLRELAGHRYPLNSLEYLDEARAISGGNDGMLRVWSLAEGRPVRAMDHGDHVVGLAVAPDKRTAWTGGWDKVTALRRWDLETGAHIEDVARLRKPCSGMALSPDGARVACVTYGGALHVFDYASGRPEVALEAAHDDRIDTVAWSPDGAHIATVSEFDQTIRLFARDGAPGAVVRGLNRPARGAFGLDGLLYVALAYDRIARFRIEGRELASVE